MEIGPIQELWLYRLENYPERQMTGRLGEYNSKTDEYSACCLGEYLITYKRAQKIPFEDIWDNEHNEESGLNNFLLFDENDEETLVNSFDDLGLFSESGDIQGNYTTQEGETYGCLAEMNDDNVPWPEIAAIIRENPEKFFRESI